MRKRWLFTGAVLTVAYLGAVGFWYSRQAKSVMGLSPNEFGDFMGGTFGPLAFLWLVLQVLANRDQAEADMAAFREEQKRQAEAARPKIRFKSGGGGSGGGAWTRLIGTNVGNVAVDLRLTFTPSIPHFSPMNLASWNRGENVEFNWVEPTGDFPAGPVELVIDFVDAAGVPGATKFRLERVNGNPFTWQAIEVVPTPAATKVGS